jgi:RND family efflux transporter MFP subunit
MKDYQIVELERKTGYWRKWQGRVIGLAMGALMLAGGAGLSRAGDNVTTAPVKMMRIGNESRVSGTIIPYREVTLAAQIPGEVKYLAGKEGDHFRAGTVVVAIDDENLRARRRAAVASLMAANSALHNARIQYNRELLSPKTGKTTGFGFPMMMDDFFRGFQGQTAGPNRPWVDRWANIQTSAQAIQSARSRLLAARAQIDQLDAKLRDAQLKVPFDGQILAKLVEIGDTVQPGQPLIRFGTAGNLRIKAEVPVRLMSSLKKGMEVDARIDVAGGVRVQAWVAQIFPSADPTSHTVTVKFDLPKYIDNPKKKGEKIPLPGGPGMYAEIYISDMTQMAPWVPTVPESAIISRGSLKEVLVSKKGGGYSLRMVRLGDRVAGGRIAVLSGLKGDETVITGPPEVLSSMPLGMAGKSGGG